MTIPTPGSVGRRPVISKKPIAADALSLDRLIREGPPDEDLIGALDSMRLKILDQGIKSDTDGMVRLIPQNEGHNVLMEYCVVLSANLRLAHPPQRPNP